MPHLGKYHLVTELSRGGMGIVWLAERRGPRGFVKRCVVKELLPELALDPHRCAMFLDEASLAARLAHRNIVQTQEVGEDGGRWFMVLELLDGITLRRLQDLAGPRGIAPMLAVRIVSAVLRGLHHAHELTDEHGAPLGTVHRDVTPQNVFVTFDGEVKLLDFGVAKSRAPREVTRDGFAKGTLAYMSPDHVAPAAIDRRADVFAAGVILRELLTGERLWGDLDDRGIVCRLVIGDVPTFEARHAARVPAALRRLCERATAPDRADRFATAHHMAEALDAWLSIEDAEGGLATALAPVFDGPLAAEREAVRARLRAEPAGATPPKRPPPLPSRAQTMELATGDILVAPAPAPPSHRAARRRAPFAKRETISTVMAAIAVIAAIASVAASQLDDDGPTATTEPEPQSKSSP